MTVAREALKTDSLWAVFKLFWCFATPRTLALKIVIAFAIRLWIGQWSVWDAVVLAAIVVYWPLQEWFFHMNLLHFKPKVVFGWTLDPGPGRAHRFHHQNPAVLETTFLPFKAVLILIPINIAVWSVLMNTWALTCSGVCFFTCAALLYEWTHYITHTPYKPKTKYVQMIFRNHRLHHFKHEAYWHAFTVPMVDTLFGTNPDPNTVETSPSVRTLGV